MKIHRAMRPMVLLLALAAIFLAATPAAAQGTRPQTAHALNSAAQPATQLPAADDRSAKGAHQVLTPAAVAAE